eukprot:TRINITY_DN155_c0_g1_i1.p1 TRINITY_DN155_c0_g1~~TRINITY_DN155_c0_g1_i1.p1  ORF type:complete len:686 (-),score=171.82 TRINITY_DN155_c0_g1_i1:99-2156(-)
MKAVAVLVAVLSLVVLAASINLEKDDVKLPPIDRARMLLKQMTASEKLGMVHGYGGLGYVGNIAAVNRLNIPQLNLEDGPQGVGDGTSKVTAWPSALTVVGTWDRELMHQFGQGMGYEQRLKGTNIMLGPMVNLLRVPVDGRSFESMGEDPFLAGEMAATEIRGIQSNGIMGCVKHLVDNNQEYNRTTTSALVDERTQYEMYLYPFKAAIDAGVASIMCSYNRVNNRHACQCNDTLNTAVKARFGFKGFIMSDWGATHSTVLAANSGLDMQMPDASFFGSALAAAVAKGEVPQSRIDDMALRILTAMFMVGIMDTPQTGNLAVNAMSPAHDRLARTLAAAGTILLQNNGNILPLATNLHNIAIVGDDASLHPTAIGYGSGQVVLPYLVTPLQGITKYLNTLKSTTRVQYAASANMTGAKAIAHGADAVIVFVAVDSSEGIDRTTLSLGDQQDDLITAMRAVNPNVIVVIHSPGPVLMPWQSTVRGIVMAMLPGQEDGNAIAEVLFGEHNPTAKLPFSIPKKASEIAVNTIRQYPGINNEAEYSEGLLIGYRWYDAHKITPLFEFGFGLSYTTFQISGLQVSGSIANHDLRLSVNVRNTGHRDGAEVVQLYLGFPAAAGEPPKQLKGFEKVYLEAGQSREIHMRIPVERLHIWDIHVHDWKVQSGVYTIYVGDSSRNTPLTHTFHV